MSQIRPIGSTQHAEIATLKNSVNEVIIFLLDSLGKIFDFSSKLESQLSVHRQRYSQLDKEKQNLQQLLQEEINHRNNVDSKLRQAEVMNKKYSSYKEMPSNSSSKILNHSMFHVLNFNNILSKLKMNEW